jgi:hypothetical protein
MQVEAHTIWLVFNDEGLRNISLPCFLVQHFVNHNAVLHKVYVIGDSHFTVKRPSIRDLDAQEDHPSINFYSSDVSKAKSASPLNIAGAVTAAKAVPNEALLLALLDKLRAKLGLSLFGVDVVIENDSENLHVVDVNYFPGYNGGDVGGGPGEGAGWAEDLALFLANRLKGDGRASSRRPREVTVNPTTPVEMAAVANSEDT